MQGGGKREDVEQEKGEGGSQPSSSLRLFAAISPRRVERRARTVEEARRRRPQTPEREAHDVQGGGKGVNGAELKARRAPDVE